MTLAEQFFALDSLLMRHRQYWQCTAFDFDTIPWPELQGILNELTDDQVTVLDNDQNQLYQFFSQHINQLDELAKLCELPSSAHSRVDYPFWISNGIKGRKFVSPYCIHNMIMIVRLYHQFTQRFHYNLPYLILNLFAHQNRRG